MDDLQLTADQERCLRDQIITAAQPGAVLHDFRVLLDFIGTKGVEAAGKYNLLPMKIIGELDSHLSRPLRLEATMKRPQIRSHPYLQGLNLLLRASELGRVEGVGDKSRLVLDPQMLVQWDQLNPTEQYFNLLEAWLLYGRPEMVGDPASSFNDMLWRCLNAWQKIPAKGLKLDLARPQHVHISGIGRDFYKLALMDLFGLVRVDHPSRPVTPWVPAGLGRLPFGDAVFTLLSHSGFDPGRDEDDEEGEERYGFEVWQPLFQPYFPEWRQNLELAEPEMREGTYIFRVSLGKDVWRRIALPSDQTLEDLVGWILRSVGFDSDHLYEFTYRDRSGARVSVSSPYSEESPSTDEVLIGELPLEPKQSMQFLYDYGDYWRFEVKLEAIEPPGATIKAPGIIERHGKSPKQYGHDDG